MENTFFIQKVCSCASAVHLKLLVDYLKKNDQKLSAKLLQHLIDYPQKSIDDYAHLIYDTRDVSAIKNLNQLNHHTLKYFSYISRNYPSFLWHAMNDIELSIHKNNHNIQQVKNLIHVALKFEDFKLLSHLHTYIQLQPNLIKHLKSEVKKIDVILEDLAVCEQLLKIDKDSISHYKSTGSLPGNQTLEKVKVHFNSKSKSASLLSRQVYLNLLSHTGHKDFYKDCTLELINETLKLSEKHPYLLIAIHSERIMSLDYFLVKHTRLGLNEKEINKVCSKIIKKWRQFNVDDKSLNVGLTLSLSIKGSHYITDHYLSHIQQKLQEEIIELNLVCQSLLDSVDWEKEGHLKYINLVNVHAIYLILNDDAKNAASILERLLHEFQQVNFQKMYDGIFVILIMAYFQIGDYDLVVSSYNRYKKITKGMISVEENDLIIKGLYYCSQLSLKKLDQYEQKLSNILDQFSKREELTNNKLLLDRAIKTIA